MAQLTDDIWKVIYDTAVKYDKIAQTNALEGILNKMPI